MNELTAVDAPEPKIASTITLTMPIAVAQYLRPFVNAAVNAEAKKSDEAIDYTLLMDLVIVQATLFKLVDLEQKAIEVDHDK